MTEEVLESQTSSGSSYESDVTFRQLIAEARRLTETPKLPLDPSSKEEHPQWQWQLKESQTRVFTNSLVRSESGRLESKVYERSFLFEDVKDQNVVLQALLLSACVGNISFVLKFFSVLKDNFLGAVKLISAAVDGRGCTPLHHAVLRGHKEIVRLLLMIDLIAEPGTFTEKKQLNTNTLVSNVDPLVEFLNEVESFLETGRVGVINSSLLEKIQREARVQAYYEYILQTNDDGWSALHLCLVSDEPRDLTVFDLLLKAFENDPIIEAGDPQASHPRCFLERFEDENDYSILHYICLRQEDQYTAKLLERFKKYTAVCHWTKNPWNNGSRDHCLTPLHIASQFGQTQTMEQLLKPTESELEAKSVMDVNINAVDCCQRSALHWAVYQRDSNAVDVLISVARERQLALYSAEEDGDSGRTPVQLALDSHSHLGKIDPNLEKIGTLLLKTPEVGSQVDKLYRDRQVYVDGSNAMLVGAALIASVTFAGWLQPPLGFTPYEQFPVPGPAGYKSFAAVEDELRVRIFWTFNSLSFFTATATVMAGAATVLPRRDLFIGTAVRKIKRWLTATSVLLIISIMCGLGAFTAAGFASLPPIWALEANMVATTVIGLLICLTVGALFVRGFGVKIGKSMSLTTHGRTRQQKKSEPSKSITSSRVNVMAALRQAESRLDEMRSLRLLMTTESVIYRYSVLHYVRIEKTKLLLSGEVSPLFSRLNLSDLIERANNDIVKFSKFLSTERIFDVDRAFRKTWLVIEESVALSKRGPSDPSTTDENIDVVANLLKEERVDEHLEELLKFYGRRKNAIHKVVKAGLVRTLTSTSRKSEKSKG